jgi:SMC interacting uncharacterized protein involved in chromosome segregation
MSFMDLGEVETLKELGNVVDTLSFDMRSDMTDLRKGMAAITSAMNKVDDPMVRLTEENEHLKEELKTLQENTGSTVTPVGTSTAESGFWNSSPSLYLRESHYHTASKQPW